MSPERKERVAHVLSLILSLECIGKGLAFRRRSAFILRPISNVCKREFGLILSPCRKPFLQSTSLKSGTDCRVKNPQNLDTSSS